MYNFWMTYGALEPTPGDAVINGAFTADQDWLKGQGWSITAGKASCDGYFQEAILEQKGVLEIGKEYRFSMEILDYVTGAIEIHTEAGPISPEGYTADQIVQFTFVANGTDLRIYGKVDFEGSVTNVKCEYDILVRVKLRPIYDKFAIKTEREAGQYFYREKAVGQLTLVGGDYDIVINAAIDQRFTVTIQKYYAGSWQDRHTGYFYRLDCEINADAKQLTCELTPDDTYGKIISGLDKEYNIVDLDLPTEEVTVKQRPIYQLYLWGAETLCNICGQMVWEAKANVTTDHDTLVNDYRFMPDLIWLEGTGSFAGATQNFIKTNIAQYDSEDGYWTMFASVGTWIISNPGTGANASANNPTGKQPWELTYTVNSGTGTVKVRGAYARILCGSASIYGGTVTAYARPTVDIVSWEGGHGFVAPYFAHSLVISTDSQMDGTKYGKVKEGPLTGRYWTKAGSIQILQAETESASIWLDETAASLAIDSADGKTVTLRDCYALERVVDKLLSEIGSTARHLRSSAYSQWLYALIDVGLRKPRLYITPKSNVLNSGYKDAASRAMLTLGQVFEVFRNAYRAFWHLEENTLHIEHVKYYQRGNRYSSPSIQVDISTMLQPGSNLPWSFMQNRYKFERQEMPQRIETGWMDPVSKLFSGEAMEVVSNYVEEGITEQRKVTKFTTDIDFIFAGADVSKDGFVLIDTTANAAPFVTVNAGGENYKLQNGYLSMAYLQQNFHVSDLPADTVKIWGENVTLIGNKSMYKVSTAEIPTGAGWTVYRLIKTPVGDGLIRNMEEDLVTRMTKIELEYDTE